MKILHVVPTYYPAVRYGGPIWSVHSLCSALVRRGHEVLVATTNVDGPGTLTVSTGESNIIDGVNVFYFPSPLFRRLYWSPQLHKFLMEQMPSIDFLHLHSVFLWPTSSAARVAELYKIPWCVAPRGALVPSLVKHKNHFIKSLWLSLIERRTLEKAAFIHVTAEQEACDVNGFGFNLPQVKVIPNGVDIPEIDSNVVQKKESIQNKNLAQTILFLGRITWKKGLDRLITSLLQIPNANLVIAGNDEEGLVKKLTKLSIELGISNRVIFTGPVYGDQKVNLLRNSSILVLPSYNENFGNVVLESLACGRPVAVTEGVGAAKIVSEANVGIILPNDPVSMGVKLASLLSNPFLLDEMGARGLDLVRNTYSWDVIASQMEAAYMKSTKVLN